MGQAIKTGRPGWRAMAASFGVCVPSALAAQTPAGTAVVNVANMRADSHDAATSNTVTLIVAERLDCTLTLGAAGAASAALVLTNPGNGREAFVVTGSAGTTSRPVAIDDAGDGRFDPARDQVLAGGVTPALAPGASLRLLVPLGDTAQPTLTVTARAVTGSGAPGTAFVQAGDGGGDAIVGATGAAARLTIALAAEAPPAIVETQSVLAADGSATARRGSVVTYTIATRFVSASPAARVVDPIPANTAYRPGTLTLDDAAIADADRVADGRITVVLGAVEAGAVHRIGFKVVIL